MERWVGLLLLLGRTGATFRILFVQNSLRNCRGLAMQRFFALFVSFGAVLAQTSWQAAESKDPMTDRVLTSVQTVAAENPKVELSFACDEADMMVYLFADTFLASEGEKVSVQYRFDKDPAEQQEWTATVGEDGVRLDGGRALSFYSKTGSASTLLFRVYDYRGRSYTFNFSVVGLARFRQSLDCFGKGLLLTPASPGALQLNPALAPISSPPAQPTALPAYPAGAKPEGAVSGVLYLSLDELSRLSLEAVSGFKFTEGSELFQTPEGQQGTMGAKAFKAGGVLYFPAEALLRYCQTRSGVGNPRFIEITCKQQTLALTRFVW